MAIHTSLTQQFDLRYPIVSAPMARVAGGKLAAAVSNAGGLGMVGGGYGDPHWLRTELDIVSKETRRPWGVGFITWHVDRATVDLALSYAPSAVFLSFGDPLEYAARVTSTGAMLICQVQDVEAARQAVAAGADFVVAQGTEAGGHGAPRATLPLVPAVVDAISPVPVLAAGGIADGRGLAAALMLGAQGAVMGTRFLVSTEALIHKRALERIIAAGGADTVRTRVFDPVRGYAWPEGFTARVLRNHFSDRWTTRQTEFDANLDSISRSYLAATQAHDYDTTAVFAGEAVDLIETIESAHDLVLRIGQDAETCLLNGCALVDQR